MWLLLVNVWVCNTLLGVMGNVKKWNSSLLWVLEVLLERKGKDTCKTLTQKYKISITRDAKKTLQSQLDGGGENKV